MLDLSLDGAEISKGFVNKYLEMGNHLVKAVSVTAGKSTKKGSPFIEITVQNEAELSCSQQYYLNGGAWNISKSAIVTLVAAANGTDEAGAKKLIADLTEENIADKVGAALIGKKFGITLNGQWVNPQDESKKSWRKSVFGSYLFAVPANQMNLLGKPYIKDADKDNRAANGGSQQPEQSGAIAAAKELWED